jgi:hypothetical protein
MIADLPHGMLRAAIAFEVGAAGRDRQVLAQHQRKGFQYQRISLAVTRSHRVLSPISSGSPMHRYGTSCIRLAYASGVCQAAVLSNRSRRDAVDANAMGRDSQPFSPPPLPNLEGDPARSQLLQ